MPQIDVRPIALADTRALRQQVLRPNQSVEELASHEPPDSVAFGAFTGDQLVAVGLVGREGDDPGDWRVRGMAAKPEARGQGAGTRVLQALVQYATTNGATRVWCNARTRALTLYERAGFIVTSDEFEPPDIGPHYRVELSIE